jgi:hypothetical protein
MSFVLAASIGSEQVTITLPDKSPACVAEHYFMSGSRKNRSQLPAHQARTQDADMHTA